MNDPTNEQLPRTLRGRFWFVEHPSLVMAGDLIISAPHKYDLRLTLPHYGLHAPEYWESMMGKTISILLGMLENGRPLTLCDCVIYSSSASYEAPRSVCWHELHVSVHRCLIGAHITQPDSVRLRQFSSFFTGFNQWASDYDHEVFSNDDGGGLTVVKRCDAIEGLGHVRIWRAGGGNSTVGNIGKRIEIRYWRPSFEPLEPLPLDRMLDTIADFQRLLCLFQGRAVGFNDLRAEMLPNNVADSTSEGEEIEMMVMMTGYKACFEPAQHFETLVGLRDITECWPSVLSKWFNQSKAFAAPLNLYFAVTFAADLFDEQRFLFLAQALEGYHRCKFCNERTFLERLTELTRPISDLMDQFVADQTAFCRNVLHTRNELTHPGLGKVDLVVTNTYTMWRQLKAIFEICVLTDLGIASDVLLRIAKECNEWTA